MVEGIYEKIIAMIYKYCKGNTKSFSLMENPLLFCFYT